MALNASLPLEKEKERRSCERAHNAIANQIRNSIATIEFSRSKREFRNLRTMRDFDVNAHAIVLHTLSGVQNPKPSIEELY